MLRTKSIRLLILILALIGVANHAMAFTVRFGPVSVAHDTVSMHRTSDADIPTPRMFNVAIGIDGITFGPPSIPDTPIMVPSFKINSRAASHGGESPGPSNDRNFVSDRQLSGIEIMLLRQAEQVAVR
jgi:hypothetical protein